MDIAEHMVEDLAAKYPNRTFKQHDFVADPLPATKPDLVMSRDIFFHLSHSSVIKAVHNIKASGGKYLLTTTFPNTRTNAHAGATDNGWYPINVMIAPFNFPEAVYDLT